LDDDANKHGRLIHRVPILGPCSALAEAAARTGATLALVAMPRASGARRRRVVGFAHAAGIPCKTLPSLDQLVSGQAVVSQIRPVEIEDLLGRAPISTDLCAIAGKI